MIIKIFWDDNEYPSVLAPLGDFFCIGQSLPANFQSLPFTVSVRTMDDHKYGGTSAANCYLTMPFNKRARVEVENQGDNAYVQVQVCSSNPDSWTDHSTITSIMNCTLRVTAKTSCIFTRSGKERIQPMAGRPVTWPQTLGKFKAKRTSTQRQRTSYWRQREQGTISDATILSHIFRT